MSAILDELIRTRQRGVEEYAGLLDLYIKLARDVERPEENEDYPESVRGSGALRALYDNTDGDEALALRLHEAVLESRLNGFRGDSVKGNRIKRKLSGILGDDGEVERLYRVIERQEEY